MADTLESLTVAFDGLCGEDQLRLLARLASRLPDCAVDYVWDGLDQAAREYGFEIAETEGLNEDEADRFASDLAYDIMCKSRDANERSRQIANREAALSHALNWQMRRAAA